MSSPSQPVNIRSSYSGLNDPETQPASYVPSAVGTPDLRALRAQYAGTPPVPNIPPRNSGTPTSRPDSSSVSLAGQVNSTPRRSAVSQTVGGISAGFRAIASPSGAETPPVVDLDDLPDEEKAKVLARHLVPGGARKKSQGEAGSEQLAPTGSGSATPRSRHSSGNLSQAQDPVVFPIPYDAPGADVT